MKKNRLYILCSITTSFLLFTGCFDSSQNLQNRSIQESRDMPPPPPDGKFPKAPNGEMPPPPGDFAKNGFPPPPPGGRVTKPKDIKASYVLKDGESLLNNMFESKDEDENVLQIKGDNSASLENVIVKKTEGKASSNEESSFYGVNAAILALDNSNLTIKNSTITANAEGATGVFAYGNSTIDIKDSKIDVTGGNAGGIEVAGGGKIYAKNLKVNTSVKAAIRSDRGGGEIVVDGGTYNTKGSSGAPAIYSTANIIVKNAKLISNNSEAVVIEGFNSVTIVNSDVTGNMTKSKDEDINLQNVMLYQSMSGDSKIGTSKFTMKGGSLTSKSGDMFYVTNTSSVINLEDVKLNRTLDDSYTLLVSGNNNKRAWGRKGFNGGVCKLNLTNQTIGGDIKVDSISKLDINLSKKSLYKGAINRDKTRALSLDVKLDSTSKWILTADSYITKLEGNVKNIILNGHKLYIGGVLFKG